MTMQTDVKAYHTLSSPANAGLQLLTGRLRLRGYQVAPGGQAGQINFYDGTSATAQVLLQLDVTTNTAIISTTIPGEGILFQNGVFCNISGTSPTTTFTLFYS